MAKLENVNATLAEIKKIRRTRAQLKKQDEQLKKEISEKKEIVRRLIVSGVSTGDRIQDFALARFGEIDPIFVRNYRKLEKHLAGKKGELVALFTFENVRMYGPRDETRTEIWFHLAVLRDDKLKITIGEKSSCTLPIDSYATCKDHVFAEKNHEIVRGSFHRLWSTFTTFEVLKGHGRKEERPSERHVVAVLAGTQAVRSLVAYEYLTLLDEDKARMKRAEQELGLFELESEASK